MPDRFDEIAGTAAAAKEPRIPRAVAGSVALLSDVHANIHALRAVFDELDRAPVDLVVFGGDTTWGTFPAETVDLINSLPRRLLVRGNADRAVLELADEVRPPATPREPWMRDRHRAGDVDFLRDALFQVDVEVPGVGTLRICHGSPRADIEIMTPGTPMDRVAAAVAGVDADVLVTGHTHLQFDRALAVGRVRRHINPGSVGLPYHAGEPGARWARVTADGVEFRRTPYDVEAHLAALKRSDDPARDRIAELLREPPTPDELIVYAEERVFSD
ncbi:putative phosphodiesterase [Asanoa ferruginea]|uniref:Putative phosphodiesterase n=1 Tax=Asanoa ferruginea TaxID=53367 RepID=A0A3D9ZPY7_9ACTN|nr:metallophosphoesterase family protein [Asanoa ferruginea]REF98939.1 putative phosphodiesterase [Asanoa ferruginea]GIF46379.1 phosphoesterase [Asanoa ferruginea]